MHELGHSLGLTSVDYSGIDSRQVPFEAYPSVMNYNRPTEFVGYHVGEPFDDWAHIATELHTPLTTRATARGRAASDGAVEGQLRGHGGDVRGLAGNA